MFDIGFSELFLIGIVALIVLGPERLPKAARFAGLWVRRARAQWHSVKGELERELAAEELQRSMRDARRAAADIDAEVRSAGEEARREFDAMRRDIESHRDDEDSTTQHESVSEIDSEIDPTPETAAATTNRALTDARPLTDAETIEQIDERR